MSRQGILCALSVLVAFGTQARAADPTAEQIARRTVARVTELADRCINGVETDSNRCVARIEELLKKGKTELARRTAKECVERINRRTAGCREDIRKICERALKLIREAGGGAALAERVKAACAEQVKKIGDARGTAIEKIRAALPQNGGA